MPPIFHRRNYFESGVQTNGERKLTMVSDARFCCGTHFERGRTDARAAYGLNAYLPYQTSRNRGDTPSE